MRKEICAYEKGYRINNLGIVTNSKGLKVKGFLNQDGYKIFSIRNHENKTVKVFFHRLMAYQKYGDKLYNKGIVTRHFNGNKLDNSKHNILIGTHSQNMMDIPKEIRVKKAKHASSFLKKYDHEEVKKYHRNCKSYKKTMGFFGITSKATLHHILKQSV